MNYLKCVLSFILVSVGFITNAQTSKEITDKIISERNYVFIADTAIPMASAELSKVMNNVPGSQGGGSINLTGAQYDLTVTKDSIIAYLPYYGRAYNPTYNSTDGGIKFTAKKFSYTQNKTKKGSYNIQINTDELRPDNYRLSLSISQNGYASLVVSSNNKQPITFNGRLSEAKKDKDKK